MVACFIVAMMRGQEAGKQHDRARTHQQLRAEQGVTEYPMVDARASETGTGPSVEIAVCQL